MNRDTSRWTCNVQLSWRTESCPGGPIIFRHFSCFCTSDYFTTAPPDNSVFIHRHAAEDRLPCKTSSSSPPFQMDENIYFFPYLIVLWRFWIKPQQRKYIKNNWFWLCSSLKVTPKRGNLWIKIRDDLRGSFLTSRTSTKDWSSEHHRLKTVTEYLKLCSVHLFCNKC